MTLKKPVKSRFLGVLFSITEKFLKIRATLKPVLVFLLRFSFEKFTTVRSEHFQTAKTAVMEALLLHSWIRDLLRHHLSVVPLQAGCQSPLTGCLPNLTHGFARAVTQCSRTRRQTPPHEWVALTNQSLQPGRSVPLTLHNHRKDFPSCTFI